eukprot:CAMPEP_0170186934 /NCGR_PEP_ID=MMETSP0040_2-20121228/40501_1 /TAXON_ID=641309 /ORGANISM="Lotharella oceanica, Strain CCMP622" /LENGTH=64 /DNA_ID=CAMNT_0010433821 /DNA_START=114 /DNA_END=308 /DNA_ORIENTATION=-
MKDAVTGLPYDMAHVISVVTGMKTTNGKESKGSIEEEDTQIADKSESQTRQKKDVPLSKDASRD